MVDGNKIFVLTGQKIELLYHWRVCLHGLLILWTVLLAAPVWGRPLQLQMERDEIVRVPIGKGMSSVGAVAPQEGNPEGPMSFAVGEQEEVFILDQLNARILIFRAKQRVGTIPLNFSGSTTYSDIELLPGNRIVLLGKDYPSGEETSTLYLIDLHGRLFRRIPVQSPALGVRVIEHGKFSGIWIEQGNEMTRVATLSGEPEMAARVDGILSFDGKKIIRAEIKKGFSVELSISVSENKLPHASRHTISFDGEILQLLGIWNGSNDDVFLATVWKSFSQDQKNAVGTTMVVIRTGEGEVGRFNLAVQKTPYEIARPLRVTPDGRIFQMLVERRFLSIVKYKLRFL